MAGRLFTLAATGPGMRRTNGRADDDGRPLNSTPLGSVLDSYQRHEKEWRCFFDRVESDHLGFRFRASLSCLMGDIKVCS